MRVTFLFGCCLYYSLIFLVFFVLFRAQTQNNSKWRAPDNSAVLFHQIFVLSQQGAAHFTVAMLPAPESVLLLFVCLCLFVCLLIVSFCLWFVCLFVLVCIVCIVGGMCLFVVLLVFVAASLLCSQLTLHFAVRRLQSMAGSMLLLW